METRTKQKTTSQDAYVRPIKNRAKHLLESMEFETGCDRGATTKGFGILTVKNVRKYIGLIGKTVYTTGVVIPKV